MECVQRCWAYVNKHYKAQVDQSRSQLLGQESWQLGIEGYK